MASLLVQFHQLGLLIPIHSHSQVFNSHYKPHSKKIGNVASYVY